MKGFQSSNLFSTLYWALSQFLIVKCNGIHMKHFFSKVVANFKLLFTSSSSLSKKDLKDKKKIRNRTIGYTLVTIQSIIVIIFLFGLLKLNILPNKYLIMLFLFLLLITIYNIASQFTKAHIFGKLLAVFLSIVLLIGSIYISKTNSMFSSISTVADVKTEYFSVIVLNTDTAATLSEAQYYTFGYHASIDNVNSEKVVSKINDELTTNLKTATYDDWDALVKSLYAQNVKAIIINESYRSDIEKSSLDFNDKTKVLETIKFESKITKTTKNVISEPFTIYVAGNDEPGAINTNGKNDVNIIATFNPETRQVILVTTPRDYFIKIYTLSESGVKVDKLTHAGNFTVNSSMATLSNLYGIDLDYYLRINFTGAIGIVNALSGITIKSEVDFTTTYNTSPLTYHFVAGDNFNCDGDAALAFCRERDAFLMGDNQRGRNQMFAIQGIIAKATSPTILMNYSSVMDSVSGMFATSMQQQTMTSLIKDMLNNSTPWNVQTYNVTGISGPPARSNLYPNDPTLQAMSVTYPDSNSISTAIDLMNKIKNGEIFDVNAYLKNNSANTSAAQ